MIDRNNLTQAQKDRIKVLSNGPYHMNEEIMWQCPSCVKAIETADEFAAQRKAATEFERSG